MTNPELISAILNGLAFGVVGGALLALHRWSRGETKTTVRKERGEAA